MQAGMGSEWLTTGVSTERQQRTGLTRVQRAVTRPATRRSVLPLSCDGLRWKARSRNIRGCDPCLHPDPLPALRTRCHVQPLHGLMNCAAHILHALIQVRLALTVRLG